MSEIKYLIQVILSKGFWIKTKNSTPTRNFAAIMQAVESVGAEPWWLAVKNSESSENVIGVFYINNNFDGWNCIDWDESKIISLYDFVVEAKKIQISESEEFFV